jgi:zinc protease
MNIRTLSSLVFAAALSALAVSLPAQNRPSAVADIPKIQIEKYTLPNGLDVILSEDHRLPLTAVNVWYHVGPSNEAAGRTGFAHLFEHMMFQCSKHVPCDSHIRLLEAAGASDLNGTTDYDRTNYFETVPANELDLALWLESDRMGYLLDKVDQPALSNQQDVVRNERRQSVENQPYGLAEEALVQALFPRTHPYYGNVIGSHEDIQAAKLDDVKNFFKQYYAPNNASLVIIGDIDRARTKTLVQKYFGTLKRGPAVPPINAETPKITAERRLVVPARVELPRVYMAWVTSPIFKPGDADADMTAEILGGGRSSRLYKKLVYEKQIAQTVTAQQYSLILGSIFQIEATARPGHTVDELEKAIDEELAGLRATPPPAREVEQARNTIETNIVGSLERPGGVANRLNSYNHFLGTPDYLQKDIERYRGVTAANIVCAESARGERTRGAARDPRHARAGPTSRDTPGAAGGARGGRRSDQRRRAMAKRDAEGRNGNDAEAPDAAVGHVVERAHAAPQRAAGHAHRRGQPRAQDRQRRESPRQAGPRQFRGGHAR